MAISWDHMNPLSQESRHTLNHYQNFKKTQVRRHKRRRFDPWVWKMPWRKKWQPNPVFLPGKSHRQRSLVGYGPRGRKESDTTEWLHFHFLSWFCNPIPGHISREHHNLKWYMHPYLTIAKNWKQPRCLSTDEWIKKWRAVEYYSAIKQNESMSFQQHGST